MSGSIYTLYGWRLSYYTAKVMCYFRYKNIPFVEKQMTFVDIQYRAQKHTGAKVMPIVVTPSGEWIQDTRNIIEHLELRFPDAPIFPTSPKKLFVSGLIESWADDFWIPMAMHYRWSKNDSVEFFRREASSCLVPWAPQFIKNIAADKIAAILISYLPYAGVRPAQFVMMEEWTGNMLSLLDSHFSQHQYILGAPSMADFALAGPLVAHLARDPWPKNNLISRHPHLQKWVTRIQTDNYLDAKDLAFSQNDDIPDSLTPILASICSEFVPMLEATADCVKLLHENEKFTTGEVPPLPRSTSDISFPLGECVFTRAGSPFHLWKIQLLLDACSNMSSEDKAVLAAWLQDQPYDAGDVLKLDFPRVERDALRVKFVVNA